MLTWYVNISKAYIGYDSFLFNFADYYILLTYLKLEPG